MKKLNLYNYYNSNRSVYFEQHHVFSMFDRGSNWTILNEIEQRIKSKIEAAGTALKDWNISMYRGILTGYNEAFIIDENKKNELLAEDPKSAEIIRPILRGRDINRYNYQFDDIWLINSHNGLKSKGLARVNINDYPAIKKHLDRNYSALLKRGDKGDTPYNLRNCAYLEDFYKQKIVWSDIATSPQFALIEEPIFFNNTCYMMNNMPLYVLAFLNSQVMKWYFSTIATDLGVGLRYFKQFVEILPIPLFENINQDSKENIESLLKQKKYDEIEKYINLIYDFNLEEIEIINSQ